MRWTSLPGYARSRQEADEISRRRPLAPLRRSSGPQVERRWLCAAAWCAKADPAIEGHGGSAQTVYVCAALLVDFELTREEAWPILLAWNRTCSPPWEISDLERRMDWAEAQNRVRGRLANAPRPQTAEERLFASITIIWPRRPAARPNNEIDVSDVLTATTPPEDDPRPTHPTTRSAERRPFCEHPVPIFQTHRTKARAQDLHAPCRKWNCLGCGPRKREHFQATVRFHFHQFEADAENAGRCLWRSIVPADQWERVTAFFRRRHVNYARLKDQATGDFEGDYFTVFSTEAAPGCDFTALSPHEAAEQFCAIVASMPSNITVSHLYSSSRDWALLADERKKDENWDTHGACGSRHRLKEVLRRRGIAWWMVAIPGRFWSANAMQFDLPRYLIDAIKFDMSDDGWNMPSEINAFGPRRQTAAHILTDEEIFLSG